MRADTAAVVRAELVPLFLAYGAPWILKSDNGPAFRADALKGFLRPWGVFSLFSPPHTPSYNGAIEAAIGSLKTRTQRLATVAGHPELWTSGLAEARARKRTKRPGHGAYTAPPRTKYGKPGRASAPRGAKSLWRGRGVTKPRHARRKARCPRAR